MKDYIPNLVFQPYVSPYVGSVGKELNSLGETLNKRYDDNIAQFDNIDALMNQIQVSDADSTIKSQLLDDTRNIIKDIVASGRWENAKAPIREITRRFRNDPLITKAQNNYKVMQELDALQAQAAMNKEPLVQFQDYKNFSTVGPDGKPRDLNKSGVFEKKLDHISRMDNLFTGLTPDGYDLKGSSPTINPENGLVYQVGSGSSARYVSLDKIKGIVNNRFNDYLNSSEGQQRLKILTTQNSENPVPLDQETAKSIMKTELLNVGKNRVFSQSSRESSQSIIAPASQLFGSGQTPGSESQLEANQFDGSQFNTTYNTIVDKLDTKPRSIVDKEKAANINSTNFNDPLRMMNAAGAARYKEGREELNDDEKAEFEKVAITLGIKGNNGKYANSDIKKITSFMKNNANLVVAPITRAFTDTEIKKAKDYLINNYDKRKYYSLTEKKFLTVDQLPEEDRKALESGKDSQIRFSGVFDTDSPFMDLAGRSELFKDQQNFDWVSPEDVTINGNRYAVSSSHSDSNKEDIERRALENKISAANRYNRPLYVEGKGMKEIVQHMGKGLYVIKDMNGNLKFDGVFTKEQLAKRALDGNLKIEELK